MMSEIISLCFSCFALGVSLTNLFWIINEIRKGD